MVTQQPAALATGGTAVRCTVRPGAIAQMQEWFCNAWLERASNEPDIAYWLGRAPNEADTAYCMNVAMRLTAFCQVANWLVEVRQDNQDYDDPSLYPHIGWPQPDIELSPDPIEERALVVRFVRSLTADELAADDFADRIDRGEHRS